MSFCYLFCYSGLGPPTIHKVHPGNQKFPSIFSSSVSSPSNLETHEALKKYVTVTVPQLDILTEEDRCSISSQRGEVYSVSPLRRSQSFSVNTSSHRGTDSIRDVHQGVISSNSSLTGVDSPGSSVRSGATSSRRLNIKRVYTTSPLKTRAPIYTGPRIFTYEKNENKIKNRPPNDDNYISPE